MKEGEVEVLEKKKERKKKHQLMEMLIALLEWLIEFIFHSCGTQLYLTTTYVKHQQHIGA